MKLNILGTEYTPIKKPGESIMADLKMDVKITGIEEIKELIAETEKYLQLLKLGYFPVTDDFWLGANMAYAIGEGFDWCYHQPLSSQKLMPWHGEKLMQMSFGELKEKANSQLLATY